MNDMSSNLKKSLELAQRTAVKSPDFLATRVLAELDASGSSFGLAWKVLSGLLTATAAVALVYISVRDTGFAATMWQPQVVKVEIAEFMPGDELEAEIILPEGVEFFSSTISELREQRTLRMAIADSNKQNQKVAPFVIMGQTAGLKKINVKFYNQRQELVLEKKIMINFKAEGT